MPYIIYYTSMLCKGCYRNSIMHFIVFVWTGGIYRNMLRVVRVFFFENGGKNSPFSRISGYISAGTKVTIALPLFKSENVRRAMKAQKVTSRSE